MDTATCLYFASAILAGLVSFFFWMLTDYTIFDISVAWLACGFTATVVSSILKDLKQAEPDGSGSEGS